MEDLRTKARVFLNGCCWSIPKRFWLFIRIDGVNTNTKVNYKTGQIYDSISKKWVNPENVELGHVTDNEYWS